MYQSYNTNNTNCSPTNGFYTGWAIRYTKHKVVSTNTPTFTKSLIHCAQQQFGVSCGMIITPQAMCERQTAEATQSSVALAKDIHNYIILYIAIYTYSLLLLFVNSNIRIAGTCISYTYINIIYI